MAVVVNGVVVGDRVAHLKMGGQMVRFLVRLDWPTNGSRYHTTNIFFSFDICHSPFQKS
jgi:hypothetical protein